MPRGENCLSIVVCLLSELDPKVWVSKSLLGPMSWKVQSTFRPSIVVSSTSWFNEKCNLWDLTRVDVSISHVPSTWKTQGFWDQPQYDIPQGTTINVKKQNTFCVSWDQRDLVYIFFWKYNVLKCQRVDSSTNGRPNH